MRRCPPRPALRELCLSNFECAYPRHHHRGPPPPELSAAGLLDAGRNFPAMTCIRVPCASGALFALGARAPPSPRRWALSEPPPLPMLPVIRAALGQACPAPAPQRPPPPREPYSAVEWDAWGDEHAEEEEDELDEGDDFDDFGEDDEERRARLAREEQEKREEARRAAGTEERWPNGQRVQWRRRGGGGGGRGGC